MTKNDPGRSPGGKLLYLDVLRAWACIAVVVVHVCIYYTGDPPASWDFIIGNGFQSIARLAVPLFVMISGALTLNESYACTPDKLKGMIRSRLVFFVLWSSVYALVFDLALPLLKGEEVSALAFLQSLVGGYHHLWFIPMVIGLYLILPLLRLWVKRENKQYVEYFLLLSLIFTSVLPFLTEKLSEVFPMFACLDSLTQNVHLQYVAGYTGYYVLGWYLHTFDVQRRGLWYAAGILGLLVTFGGTQAFSLWTGEANNFYSVFATGIVGYSAAFFLLMKQLLSGRKHSQSRLCRFVRLICRCSMGIYAVHPAVIIALFKVLETEHAMLQIPLVTLATLAISLAATLILRRLPVAKKYMV